MADHVFAAFGRCLRDREHLKCAAEVESLSGETRLLGIISNVEGGQEEGSLLLLSQVQAPLIEAIVPIYATFSLSIEQSAALPGDTGSDGPPKSPPLITTFKSGHSPALSVVASSDALGDVVKEAQRLAALARVHDFQPGRSHGYTALYRPASKRARRRDPSSSLSSAHAHLISRPLNDLRTGRRRASQQNEGVQSALNVDEIRMDWITRQMASRQDGYTVMEPIKILVCSYNVADRIPDASLVLKSWLQPDSGADVMIIGLQELDMGAEALLRWTPVRQDAWSKAIDRTLASDYEQIRVQQFASMCSFAYARRETLDRLGATVIQSSGVGTGTFGAGNKGATALRIQLGYSVLTFVNCHLAAGDHLVARRNHDLADIFRRLSFPIERASGNIIVQRPKSLRVDMPSGLETAHVFETDAIWVSGDLNYRIEPRSTNAELVKQQKWTELLELDQLNAERAARRALAGFVEGEITHGPTYKYDIGTSDFDTSEKARAPGAFDVLQRSLTHAAWTDRILWGARDEDSVRQLSLDSHMDVSFSDHKPISSLFEVDIRVEVPEKRSEILDAVHRELDAFENDSLPSVAIEPSPAIDFAVAAYGQPASQTFHLRNTGFVVTEFEFSPKPGAPSICEPWLHVSPRSGLVLPGDSASITATVLVDPTTAESFNFGEKEIEDILILRLIGGRDLFVSVSARKWQRTCFGNHLERLSWLDRAIRDYSAAELEALVAKPPVSSKATVPRVIARLTEWIIEHASDVEGLFVTAVEPGEVAQIREALDTGAAFSLKSNPGELKLSMLSVEEGDLGAEDGILHETDTGPQTNSRMLALAIADTLLQLLASLPQPVITKYEEAIAADGIEGIFSVIAAIPRVNSATLTHIVSFLRAFLMVHPEETRDSIVEQLSVVFANALFRTPQPPSTTPSQPARRKLFVKTLLTDPAF